MTRAKDMFSSMRDTATKVTVAASEIYEKVEEGKEMYEDMKGRVEAGKDLIDNLKDKPFTHMGDIVDNAKTIAGIDDEEEGGAEETKGAEDEEAKKKEEETQKKMEELENEVKEMKARIAEAEAKFEEATAKQEKMKADFASQLAAVHQDHQ